MLDHRSPVNKWSKKERFRRGALVRYRNEVTRTVYSALTKIQGANSKQARENFHRMGVLKMTNFFRKNK